MIYLKPDKVVIIINGKGGVGKDTVCDITAKHYNVQNVSAITPIKNIAKLGGWNGEKDEKARKLLSDLKRIFIEYNDLPSTYLLDEFNKFMNDDEAEILFMHIREGSEIDKIKKLIACPCVTLLIERPSITSIIFGNASDDEVTNYIYDYIYMNDSPNLEALSYDFINFLRRILAGLCDDSFTEMTNRIIELYKQGLTLEEITKKTDSSINFTRSTIEGWVGVRDILIHLDEEDYDIQRLIDSITYFFKIGCGRDDALKFYAVDEELERNKGMDDESVSIFRRLLCGTV